MSGTLGPREEVRRGVRESIPLGFALVPVGLGFGSRAHVVGLALGLDGQSSAVDEGGRFDAGTVASWTGLGATWLGGCCGTGPADIADLATHLARPAAAAVPATPRATAPGPQ